MHFTEAGAWQGLKPVVHPNCLRGAEAPLFHGEAVLLAFSATCQVFFSNPLCENVNLAPDTRAGVSTD
jgi:hypothetical protein